ncbi:hypothetical protein PCASD_08245 [Puccinia coronata f. sp. avenae]|uniref:Integrase catalytic domain-containing protein n=1 Tax=Puccinia coronata f. sp. avenae TaxID=200324 RepID=A0A2N5ULH9_9BASI|nr:hypothetical protein PCASD_08245 [Puccinia coronata f. sp. avenae]
MYELAKKSHSPVPPDVQRLNRRRVCGVKRPNTPPSPTNLSSQPRISYNNVPPPPPAAEIPIPAPAAPPHQQAHPDRRHARRAASAQQTFGRGHPNQRQPAADGTGLPPYGEPFRAHAHIPPPYPPADPPRRPEDLDRTAAAIIASVNAQIRNKDRLKSDGSNYAVGVDFLDKRMRNAINRDVFFNRPSRNPLHKRIGWSILISSVDRSIRCSLVRLGTAHEMWTDLQDRFNSVSRAAQMNVFRRLLAFDISAHSSTAAMASSLHDILDELEIIHIDFIRDYVGGLILQHSLSSEPELSEEFDCMIENHFQSLPNGQVMDVDSMFRMLDVIRRCQTLQPRGRALTAPAPTIALQAEVDDGPPTPDTTLNKLKLLAAHPDNIPDAYDFLAMRAGHCWQCQSPDHLLCNCPMCARPSASTFGRNRMPRGPANQLAGPMPRNHPAGFQSWYPIITPPRFTGVYPQQAPLTHVGQRGQQPSNGPPARPADYFRPNYGNRRPANSPAHPAPPSQPSTNEASVPPGFNSTAWMVELGDVNNGLANINFGHVEVTTSTDVPIVDSATSANNAYITGEGDLTFHGANNQRVTIHGVLYCEIARSTLISLAALQKANAYFSYNIIQDCFNVFSRDNILVFRCPFVPLHNKWIFPSPIIMLNATKPMPTCFPSREIMPMPLCNATTTCPPMSVPECCPISTDLRTDLQREGFVAPLNIEKKELTAQSLTRNEQILLYWHWFFGHASLKKICQLIQEKMCEGLSKSLPKGNFPCDVCARGKSINKNRLSPSGRKFKKLEVVTADLMGPFEVKTFNKGKYLLTIRDMATGFSEAKVLESKDRACNLLTKTDLRWERQTSKKVKILRTDNGGEFSSKVLDSFIKSHGIKEERAPLPERRHRTFQPNRGRYGEDHSH